VQKLLEKKNANILSESVLKLLDEGDNEDIFVKKTENQAHLMDFDQAPLRTKDRGPTIDTLDIELDEKSDFLQNTKIELKEKDPEDRKVYQKRITEKKLKHKIREKEIELAKKPTPIPVIIGTPVESDEEFEGMEDYSFDNKFDKKRKKGNLSDDETIYKEKQNRPYRKKRKY